MTQCIQYITMSDVLFFATIVISMAIGVAVGTCAGFSDAGQRWSGHALGPASEKRQGTKSREVGRAGAARSMGIEAGRQR